MLTEYLLLPTDDRNYWLRALDDLPTLTIRLVSQMFLVIIFGRMLDDNETIEDVTDEALDGKTNYQHFKYDIAFKSAVSVGLLTFSLCFCLIVPLTTPLVLLLFMIRYFMDKHDLLYLYPINFESQEYTRELLVKNGFGAILLF